MANVPVPHSPDALDAKTLYRAVRLYSKDNGWLTHRLMIEQHVQACRQDTAGFGATVLRHYQDTRRRRRGVWLRLVSMAGLGVGLTLGIVRWLA